MKKIVFIWILTAFVSVKAFAGEYHWNPVKPKVKIPEVMVAKTSTANTSWNTATTWSPNGVPASTDVTSINNTVAVDANITVTNGGTLTISAPGTLIDPAGGTNYNLTVNGGTAGVLEVKGTTTFGGSLSLANSGIIHIFGCCTLTVGSAVFSNSSQLIIDACGVLIVNGNLDMNNTNAATVNGSIIVNGNVTAGNSATMTGSGSLQASGSITSSNTATFFGSSGDCSNTGVDCYASGGFVGPLPVELIFFNAEPFNDKVELTWTTASELNNDYFTLERSKDGYNFAQIGEIDSKAFNGNSSSNLDYGFFDDEPYDGVNYYRLKQTDYDLNFKYSYIITTKSADGIVFYPNPANDYIVVKGKKKSSSVQITNLLGEVLMNAVVPKNGSIDTRHLPPGLYVICIDGKNSNLVLTR